MGKRVGWEWADVIRGLETCKQVEVRLQGKSFLLRSQLCGDALAAIRAAGAACRPPSRRRLSNRGKCSAKHYRVFATR